MNCLAFINKKLCPCRQNTPGRPANRVTVVTLIRFLTLSATAAFHDTSGSQECFVRNGTTQPFCAVNLTSCSFASKFSLKPHRAGDVL